MNTIANLSQHPLTAAMRASLPLSARVVDVNPPGRCADEHDAWLCACVACSTRPDAVIAVLPYEWLWRFVAKCWHYRVPCVRPFMVAAQTDVWSGEWVRWHVRGGVLRYERWTWETEAVR